MRKSRSDSLVRFGLAVCMAACMSAMSVGQIIFQETFEGDDSNYDIGSDSYADADQGDWAPGIWGLNTIGEQIGLTSAAPARRAAILWSHEPFADDFTTDAYETWVPLVDWAVGVEDAAARASARVGFFGGHAEESVEGVRDALIAGGYADDNLGELFDVAEVDPADFDVVVHSSALPSTAFSAINVPIISFSSGDHDDTAIAGIGQVTAFDDDVVLDVPEAARSHPALGGKGAGGTIPWTTEFTNLQGIGKTHAGGTALAFVENPDTGEPSPAIFVIEEGDALLGAWDPAPEGEQYIVGSAINKHGDAIEVMLNLGPIDVSGQADLKMTVSLAATAADFENGDYLRIEAIADGDAPEIIDEFFGVDEAHDAANESGCLKGLSNGSEPGDFGDLCLPDKFTDFTFDLPEGANSMEISFAMLSTWGNEIVGIDNVRIHSGPLPPTGPNGDFNGNGMLDAGDLDAMVGQTDAQFDLNSDGVVNYDDRLNWIKNLKNTWVGDSNLDGEFNSSDFVAVFQAGKFETGQAAIWGEGDWNGDGVFSSSDFVAAFQDGGFELGPRVATQSVPEPASVSMTLLGLVGLALMRRRK